MSYKSKILDICKAKSSRAKSLANGDAAWLSVTEQFIEDADCTCPKMSKSGTYRVGVDVSAKSARVWELQLPREFYVKEATAC